MIIRRDVSAAILVGLLMLPGCNRTLSVPADPSVSQSKPVPVKAVTVTAQDIFRTTTQPASVHPFHQAEIRGRVTGYVTEISADIGDYVEPGAQLAVIDVPEMAKQREVMQARQSRLQAEEIRSRAAVELASAGVASKQAQFEAAESQLLSANATLAASESEFERVRDLVNRQSLEGRMLDEVTKRRDSDIANRTAVQSSINSARADVDVARAQLAVAEADLQAAVAETAIVVKEMEELDALMQYATLRAPFAGIVTARTVDTGDLVRAGTDGGKVSGQPLFVISQISKVRIQMSVPETDAALVNIGDPLTLTFPSWPDDSISAAVSRLSHSLDINTRTMQVEADFVNEDNKLLPGMFGQATIQLSTKSAANMLPARAVRFTESGAAFVYVIGQDNLVSVVDVTTGLDDGQSIEIVSGVEPGQSIVDAHLRRFVTGQTVRVLDR